MGGYIAYIISFSILEYSLSKMSLAFVFGIWAAGNAILTMLIGRFFYGERFSKMKVISLVLVLIGLVGLSFS